MSSRTYLKWAGGKSKIINQMIDIIAEKPLNTSWKVTDEQSYLEPFIGSASVFLGLKNSGIIENESKVILSDINEILIATHKTIHNKKNLEKVLTKLEEMEKNLSEKGPDYYYEIRDLLNLELTEGKGKDKIHTAANMIFINKTCFNGLWRVNRNGEFNVPLGRSSNNSKRTIIQKERLANFQMATSGVNFKCNSWNKTIKLAKEGDLLYVDPPYLPINEGEYVFTDYDKSGFSLEEHKKLAKACIDAAERGVRVIISNNESDILNKIYDKKKIKSQGVDYEKHLILLRRTMKTVIGGKREQIKEAVIFLNKK